jgi:hypothetical protein
LARSTQSLNARYTNSTGVDRKRIFQRASRVSQQLAGSGNWPSALGLRIMMMNLTVGDLLSSDAVFVKLASDAPINESRGLSSQVTPLRRGRGHSSMHSFAPLEKELNEALATTLPTRK